MSSILRCVFGTRWDDHHGCLFCEAEGQRLQAQFDRDVLEGRCDQDGYTPTELKRRGRRVVSRP